MPLESAWGFPPGLPRATTWEKCRPTSTRNSPPSAGRCSSSEPKAKPVWGTTSRGTGKPGIITSRWTRVDAGLVHAFHQDWIGVLARALNAGVLPPGYFALHEQSP